MKQNQQAQHTPGPWIGGYSIRGSNGQPVCRVLSNSKWASKTDAIKYGCSGYSQSTDAETAHANARLIAAAPELVEALHRVCRDLEYAYGGQGQMPEMEAGFYSQARSALARARGEDTPA